MDREGGKRGWGGGDGNGEAHGVSNRCAWNVNGEKAIDFRYFWKNSSLTGQKTRLVLLAWEIIVNRSKILSGHQQILSVENKDFLFISWLGKPWPKESWFMRSKTLTVRFNKYCNHLHLFGYRCSGLRLFPSQQPMILTGSYSCTRTLFSGSKIKIDKCFFMSSFILVPNIHHICLIRFGR